MLKVQRSSGVRGVGPAESTGKSRVRYWPGGTRFATSDSRRLPTNPREMKRSAICPPVELVLRSIQALRTPIDMERRLAREHCNIPANNRNNAPLRFVDE